ncbi:MAG: 4-hydroxy-tetrahydrodipicolinate synthase [Armatimonadetes bacterium]|nr:4-hydroxy-tetrahydrodipicolinate synthase [Armatimonadota bacterium]
MELGRLITAMVTPMLPDGAVDYPGAARLARHLVENGNEGLVVCGTTGESPTLTQEEKLGMFRTVREAVGDRARVIAGTGNYCTRESIELTREAEAIGVDGAMLVVPYYNNPPQEGLYQHFRAIADATRLPILLYNVPTRSPRNMEAETTIRLAEVPNIVAIKEASGKLEQIGEIIARTPPSFRVYSGDDSATLPLMSMGAHGIISVAGHVAGKWIAEMIQAFVGGQVETAARLHGRLLPLFNACFCTTNPIPIKAALNLLGLPAGGVRLPLIPATEAQIGQVRAELERLELL